MAIKIFINSYLTNLKGIGVMNCHDDKNQYQFEKHPPWLIFQSQLIKMTWHLILIMIMICQIEIWMTSKYLLGLSTTDFSSFHATGNELRMMSLTQNSWHWSTAIKYQQCYELWVHDIIPSSFRVARKDEKIRHWYT